MHLHTRNVRTALKEMVQFFHDGELNRTEKFHRGINPVLTENSRNGKVLVIGQPVTVSYSNPTERVLWNQSRDANPFFHLYEALWMLAGRNDVAPLVYYNSRMADFSDNGTTLNGAYGYRWRRHINRITSLPAKLDQLELLANHLEDQPASRRAVLTMWNVEDDLLKVDSPECGGSKDVCCNLNVLFKLRHGPAVEDEEKYHPHTGTFYKRDKFLDMTVTNRSNDLLWGMLGANYVHFSILQEYMAARLGAGVGTYHHFSNNLHVYKERKDWDPGNLLAWERANPDQEEDDIKVPLVQDHTVFDTELRNFVDHHRQNQTVRLALNEPFLQDVAQPLAMAYHRWKLGEFVQAIDEAAECRDGAWRRAALEWFRRRWQRRLETGGWG